MGIKKPQEKFFCVYPLMTVLLYAPSRAEALAMCRKVYGDHWIMLGPAKGWLKGKDQKNMIRYPNVVIA